MRNSKKLAINIRRIERAEQAKLDIEYAVRPIIEQICKFNDIELRQDIFAHHASLLDLLVYIRNDELVHFSFNEYWKGEIFDTIKGCFHPDYLDEEPVTVATAIVSSEKQDRDRRILKQSEAARVARDKSEFERLNKIYGTKVA